MVPVQTSGTIAQDHSFSGATASGFAKGWFQAGYP